MASARFSGRSTPRAVVAASTPPTRAPRRATRRLIAATTASLHTGGAARAFAHVAHVLAMLLRQRVAREFHDGVGQPLAFVRLDPRLDGAAGKQQRRER